MQCRETVGTFFEPQKRHALRAAKVTGAGYTLILWKRITLLSTCV